eukprot:24653-Rhodomonas_salina.1
MASAAPEQPAQPVSEDGGAIKVGGFRDEVSEILDNLQKPFKVEGRGSGCKHQAATETSAGFGTQHWN